MYTNQQKIYLFVEDTSDPLVNIIFIFWLSKLDYFKKDAKVIISQHILHNTYNTKSISCETGGHKTMVVLEDKIIYELFQNVRGKRGLQSECYAR